MLCLGIVYFLNVMRVGYCFFSVALSYPRIVRLPKVIGGRSLQRPEKVVLYDVMHTKHNSGISLWRVDNGWNMFKCGSLHSIDKFEQMIFSSRLKNVFFCMFGGNISEDWSRFVLKTGGTKRGHFLIPKITETVGDFLMGGRSRLINGGNIGGRAFYCDG